MRAKLSVAVTLCAALSAGPKVLVAQSGAVGPKCLELAVGAASIPHDTINSFPPGEYVRGPKPVYPAALRTKKIPGHVRLRFIVRCDGSIDSKSVVVLLTTDSAFIKPAIRAVLQSTYRPAVFRGQKVSAPVIQTVRFTPESAP